MCPGTHSQQVWPNQHPSRVSAKPAFVSGTGGKAGQLEEAGPSHLPCAAFTCRLRCRCALSHEKAARKEVALSQASLPGCPGTQWPAHREVSCCDFLPEGRRWPALEHGTMVPSHPRGSRGTQPLVALTLKQLSTP